MRRKVTRTSQFTAATGVPPQSSYTLKESTLPMKFDRHKRRRNSGVFQVCAATAPATGAPQGPRRFESGAAHRDEAPLAFRLLVPLHAWHNDES